MFIPVLNLLRNRLKKSLLAAVAPAAGKRDRPENTHATIGLPRHPELRNLTAFRRQLAVDPAKAIIKESSRSGCLAISGRSGHHMPAGRTGSVPLPMAALQEARLEPMISASNATDAAIIKAFAGIPALLDQTPALIARGRFLDCECLLGPAEPCLSRLDPRRADRRPDAVAGPDAVVAIFLSRLGSRPGRSIGSPRRGRAGTTCWP